MLEFVFGQYGNYLVDTLAGLGFKSVNIGNTRIDGIEGEIGFRVTINKNLNIQLGAGYTYIEPIMVDFDTVKAQTGTVSFNILKYRYRNLFKGSGQIEYKNIALAMNTRYNSFMQNIDVVFNQLIPGVNRYRTEHDGGDWVFDARLSYRINKNINVSIISRNLFNHEYVGVPSQIAAPRMWLFQFTLTN
jgi:outer membrane receptor for monomeric catechols